MKNAFSKLQLASAIALTLGSFSMSALAEAVVERPSLPNYRFSRNLKNRDLVTMSSAFLNQVAPHHGSTGSEFRKLIARDRCLCADRQAHMYYACEVPPQAATGATGTDSLLQPQTPSTTAAKPLLHSRPDSLRKIYLDFDGHTTTGTYWNSNFTSGAAITTPPFDLDGSPTTVSTTEATRIEAIWRRVAEDYAPFDVDVTTEDPGAAALTRSGSTDTAFGVRVCVGGSCYDWFGSGAGGVAYLGSFTWNTDTPCFVFTAQLGGGHDKYTAEAASHEAGHTLGLNHDGQTNITEYYAGHGDWAPIMGVGYYKAVTQWSRGEYPNANNTQDDIAVMASYGVVAATDDHAGTQTTATDIGSAGGSISAQGLISTRTDADLFRFAAGAGAATFQAQPAALGPNLDIQLSLYDSAGTLLATENPAGLPGQLSATLTGGTYYLAVDGAGVGDSSTGYSDYGSLGVYGLSAVVPPVSGMVPIASVSQSAPTTGTVPLTVAFSSNGSYDPDGTISSFRWDFGDGSAPETVPNPVHVYQAAGTYTASLIVTDNDGLTATASTVIQVNPAPVDARMSISSISLVSSTTSRGTQVTARVTVLDKAGRPVSGVIVYANWSGVTTKSVSAKTSRTGVAGFVSPRITSPGVLTFTVNNAVKSGLTYDATLNIETSESLTIP